MYGGPAVCQTYARLPGLGEASLLQVYRALLEAFQGCDIVACLQGDIVIGQLVMGGIFGKDSFGQGRVILTG